MKTRETMKTIKERLQESFNGLTFDEEKHKYVLNTDTSVDLPLISTTTFLKRYTGEFNSYMISTIKAKKNLKNDPNDLRTAKYYRNRWKLLADKASFDGTRVHNFAECYPYFDKPRDEKEQGVVDFFNDMPDNYEVVVSELRVYDEETVHAGTIDLILYNKDTGNLVIVDWKTNDRNIFEQYRNKKLKAPFKTMEDTPFNKFTLQLSDYANMLNKNTEFKVEECWVVWLKEGNITDVDFDRHGDDAYSIHEHEPFAESTYYKAFNINMVCSQIDKEYKEYVKELNKPKFSLYQKK